MIVWVAYSLIVDRKEICLPTERFKKRNQYTDYMTFNIDE